jgi:indolepyruvate ferredoxin oxidoreductase alpha subunit
MKNTKVIMSGNEAVARGAYESGVKVAAAYPGTPSTEILENIAKYYPNIYAEWSVNEKVAFEVALGAAVAGARAMAVMKHVGVNIAMDPFVQSSYTGMNAGLVIVSCDDPGQWSSQNEQDNRYLAKFAYIPLIEPTDSQEAKDFLKYAFEISEKFDTPVMLRLTTRVSHSEGVVTLDEPIITEVKGVVGPPEKYNAIPACSKIMRKKVIARYEKLKEFVETSPLNYIENKNSSIGIITSGIAYQYVKEVMPDVNILKLGITNPIPVAKIKEFAKLCKKIFVVEEVEPYLEEQIRALGIEIEGKKYFPIIDELTPEIVEKGAIEAGIIKKSIPFIKKEEIFPRPPVMCAGCPHRGVFYVLKKLKVIISSDIGCYTLAVLPPLHAMDIALSMGASIGNAIGMDKAKEKRKVVAALGDSTFLHSGITGLLDAVYNKSPITIIILNNDTTAMTGFQDHPGTGKTLMGETTKAVDYVKLAQSLGVESVKVIDPYNYKETYDTIKEEIEKDTTSVIITNRPCVFLRKEKKKHYYVDSEKCTGCHICLGLGCPAMTISEKKTKKGKNIVEINQYSCIGCSLCAQLCTSNAIIPC